MNKNIISAKIALRIGMLSLGALSAVAPTAFAQGRNDRRQERREEKREKQDVKEARREVKRQRREAQNAGGYNRREEQRDVREAQERLRREREELRREKNDDSYEFRNRNRRNNGRLNRPAYNNGYGYGGNNGYRNDLGQRFTGTVTRVRSNQSFDVRVSNQVFNVYTTGVLPRALSVGDVVRVSGERVGSNDIRNAGFSIVTNR